MRNVVAGKKFGAFGGEMRRNIVLVGMMGAGKTAIGAELSRRLGRPLWDTDAEIERAAAMTIPEIFSRDGEAFFRAREAEVLSRVLAGGDSIVSTGGGAWMRQANRDRVAQNGISVWLDCDIDTLWHRVRSRPTRPLLQTAEPRQTLERLMAERRPVYALADVHILTTTGETIEQTADQVLAAITASKPMILEQK